MVAQIATGEVEETAYAVPGRKRSGGAGAAARAQSLSPEARKAVARAGADARWKKDDKMAEMNTDALAGLLFGRENTLVNLKLCRGDNPQVTEAELRNETHFALTQVALGMCDTHVDFPEDRDSSRVDVTTLS
jgi:hypothetical protein